MQPSVGNIQIYCHPGQTSSRVSEISPSFSLSSKCHSFSSLLFFDSTISSATESVSILDLSISSSLDWSSLASEQIPAVCANLVFYSVPGLGSTQLNFYCTTSNRPSRRLNTAVTCMAGSGLPHACFSIWSFGRSTILH